MSSPTGLSGDSSCEDFYKLLNISRQATTLEIQRSYKRLSRVFHPDKSSSNKEDAQKTFVEIKQAHDILLDPILRLAYDYGGAQVVAVIKRSQTAANAARRSETSSQSNLYTELQECKSKEEAIAFIRQIREEDEVRQQQQQRDVATAEVSVNAIYPHTYGVHSLEATESTVQLQSTLRQGDAWSLTLGSNATVQRTAMVELGTTVSADYQPHRGTHFTVDSSFRPSQPLQLSLRSSRQMASGTLIVAGLGGSLRSLKSWTYSVVTYRNLLLSSLGSSTAKGEEATKVQASWRLSFRPATGGIQQALASIKTRSFPQWSCRTGLGAFPLKLTYQRAEYDSLYLAYSQGLSFFRLKLAWIQDLGGNYSDWSVKYGVKYDGRGHIQPDFSLLSMFFNFSGDGWNINLPIALSAGFSWPFGSLVTLLVGQFCDQVLDDFFTNMKKGRSHKASIELDMEANDSKLTALYERFERMIKAVAAKKRESEEASPTGLVILSAKWRFSDKDTVHREDVDITDLVQFWVVDGKVNMSEVVRWLSSSDSRSEQSTENALYHAWRKILIFFQSTSVSDHSDSPPTTNRLFAIRYKYGGHVYDMRFLESEYEVITIPDKTKAIELGNATILS